jgi:hypothetical protein
MHRIWDVFWTFCNRKMGRNVGTIRVLARTRTGSSTSVPVAMGERDCNKKLGEDPSILILSVCLYIKYISIRKSVRG